MNLLAYRDRDLFTQLFRQIRPTLEAVAQALGRKVRMMEVCGTHTAAFEKTGIRQLLADSVELISGPGCPVCVTHQADIDAMIAYAQRPNTIVATFGDMLKVPGSTTSLYAARAEGARVKIIHSPSQALDLAQQNPHRQVVLLGVGFETTAAPIALSLRRAQREGLTNYFIYSAHKLTPPAVKAIAADPQHGVDGFLLPGHVSVIIGRQGWAPLETQNLPAVIAGFEPLDLLASIYRLVQEMRKPRRQVFNHYPRVVQEEGNPTAQALLDDAFTVSPVHWRGFGLLPRSGLRVASRYRDLDAKVALPIEVTRPKPTHGCRCDQIVTGKESPLQCPLFATACTPEHPLGPCMVSSEGTCAAYYQYQPNP